MKHYLSWAKYCCIWSFLLWRGFINKDSDGLDDKHVSPANLITLYRHTFPHTYAHTLFPSEVFGDSSIYLTTINTAVPAKLEAAHGVTMQSTRRSTWFSSVSTPCHRSGNRWNRHLPTDDDLYALKGRTEAVTISFSLSFKQGVYGGKRIHEEEALLRRCQAERWWKEQVRVVRVSQEHFEADIYYTSFVS